MPPDLPSIHSLSPREQGGPVARRGFTYQDHVAVAFYLQMVEDPNLASVWCEAQDDITLIWQRAEAQSVEFVQVKSDDLPQLWSAALICANTEHGENDDVDLATDAAPQEIVDEAAANHDELLRPQSLLEKSLAHERCAEPCTFRVVSATRLHPTLIVLCLDREHAQRAAGSAVMPLAVEAVVERAERNGRRFRSAKGSDARSWVERLVWDVRESLQAVKNANRITLQRIVETAGGLLMPDQREDLYMKLLARAKEAADARWETEPGLKKQARVALLQFVQDELRRAERPSLRGDAAVLRSKMERAELADDLIEAAWSMRQRYRQAVLNAQYLTVDERDIVESEVQACLHELLIALYADRLTDTSHEFHDRCVQALRGIHAQASPRPPLAHVMGMMYDIVARCQHQFVRLGPDDLPLPGDSVTRGSSSEIAA